MPDEQKSKKGTIVIAEEKSGEIPPLCLDTKDMSDTQQKKVSFRSSFPSHVKLKNGTWLQEPSFRKGMNIQEILTGISLIPLNDYFDLVVTGTLSVLDPKQKTISDDEPLDTQVIEFLDNDGDNATQKIPRYYLLEGTHKFQGVEFDFQIKLSHLQPSKASDDNGALIARCERILKLKARTSY